MGECSQEESGCELMRSYTSAQGYNLHSHCKAQQQANAYNAYTAMPTSTLPKMLTRPTMPIRQCLHSTNFPPDQSHPKCACLAYNKAISTVRMYTLVTTGWCTELYRILTTLVIFTLLGSAKCDWQLQYTFR